MVPPFRFSATFQIALLFSILSVLSQARLARSAELTIPSGKSDVLIRYFSLRRNFSIPAGNLIPLKPSSSEHCGVKKSCDYYKTLPVIEVSPREVPTEAQAAKYFPGVFASFLLKQFNLPEQALPGIQNLAIPRASQHPIRTLIFLPGLGSQPQFYMTTATELASHGYRVLITGHPGISGDMYTSNNCLIPGIDPAVLSQKIQDSKLIDPIMDASIEVLQKDLEVLYGFAHDSDANGRPLPMIFMGHSIGGIATNLYCSGKPDRCAGAVNLDGGDYSRFPNQAWPSRQDLPFLKFHSTSNISRNQIPEKAIGPNQSIVNFDGQGGTVLHESFTDVGFFKGISDQEMPLSMVREKTTRSILGFLEKLKSLN